MAFSGHKMCGPMGIGCLWVKSTHLSELEPFLVGGGMIDKVSLEKSTWAEIPDRFDAGTPNVAGAVGLAAACDYLSHLSMQQVYLHEQSLTSYALKVFTQLESDGKLVLYGPRTTGARAGIITFNLIGVHAHDVAQILDRKHGVAIRSGHHCNQLILETLKTTATCRASLYLYNTKTEIDQLVDGLATVAKVFQK